MATIYGTADKSWQLKIDYTVTQDTVNNKSTVAMSLYVYNNNQAYNNNENAAYYTITGTTTYATFSYDSTKSWRLLGTKTQVVNHNDDGTGSIKISARWYSGITGSSYTPTNLYINETTVTLTTIPRASKLTTSNLQNTSNYIGSALTVSWTAGSTNFTHTLKYKMSGQSAETAIASSIAAGTTSKSWTIPTSFYALCPNATNLSGTLYLYTYSGSTLIGSNSATVKVFVKEADNTPTISVTLTDTNTTTSALTGSNARIIKGYSNIKVVCAGTGKNSATIASNSITYNNVTTTVTTASQTKTFSAVATGTFKGIVTDSRGYSATYTPTTTLINYFKPTINLGVTMGMSSSTSNTATATLAITTSSYSGNFGAQSNSITVQYRYKVSGGSYSSYANATAGTGGAYSATITGLDGTKTYYFQAKVVDKLETVSTSEIKASALPVFDFDADDFNFNVPVNTKGLSVNDNPIVRYSGYDYTIPADADLNSETFTKAGCYRCGSTATARTLSHTPWGTSPSNSAGAFMLFTYYSLGHETNQGTYRYVRQELKPYSSTAVYARYVSTGATANVWTYGAWNVISAPVTDRVTSTGTSGIWRYKRWVNGDYECWTNTELTFSASPTTGLGIANFYIDYVDVDLPVTFTADAVATCSCDWKFSEWVQCQGYTDKIRVRRMGNMNSFSNYPTIKVSIIVKGRV